MVTTHTMQFGPVRSILTILGNISGLFLMSLCSVLGLSTLILYSETTFTAGQPLPGQFTLLVMTFMSLSFLCLMTFSIATHKTRQYTRPWLSGRTTGRIFGGTFIAAGAALVTTTAK